MYNELIEIRNKIDKLIEKYQDEPEPEFEYIGKFYGINGLYALYIAPKYMEKRLDLHNAQKYCKTLNASLPTLGELQHLYDNLNDESFELYNYWSSVKNSDNINFVFNFLTCSMYSSPKYTYNYVRPVKREIII